MIHHDTLFVISCTSNTCGHKGATRTMESLESEELLESLSSKCCGNGGAF